MADLKTKLTNMKVAELRSELGKLGLEKQGTKMVLVDRLLKHYETSTEDGNPVAENGNIIAENNATADAEGDETVVVDEVLDTTNDDNEVEVDDIEEEEELNEQQDESQNVEVMDENEDAEVYVEDENGEGQDDVGEDEEMEEGDETGEGKGQEDAEADTQVIGDEPADEEVEENEGDALNISVEENEVLGIEQDSKICDDEQTEVENVANDETKSEELEQSESNNTSTTGKNEAESDNKAGEGETEVSEEASTCKESERHIILVTGLSSDTSANDLKTFFRKYGKIGRIKIMTNTRVPGSQRFAHISVPSLDELKYLVETLNGVQLKGKSIRVAKAPEDGSVSRSYEIAVATAKAEADGGDSNGKEENGKTLESKDTGENGKNIDESDDVQVLKDSAKGKDAGGKKDSDPAEKVDAEKKKEEKKDSPTTDKKTPEKNPRPDRPLGHRSRKESHDRPRGEHNNMRPHQRPFRRDKDSTEWKRHGPPRGPMEVTRVHRDRPPIGRAPPPNAGGRRRSPHAGTLTFEQIREIRDEQRRREHERRKREEERERAAEVERQKRLEYQNYMEFKQLEREREKLRQERERIEREKQELIKMERERQKAEREKIEREKEELRRAKLNIEHPRSAPVKRPYEEEKVNRRRESAERKKPYPVERGRPDGKTEAERKMERERFARERIHNTHSSEGRSRSPFRASGGGVVAATRVSRRDVWARDERETARPSRVRTRSDERSHRRETEAEKVAAAERRSREAPSRAAGSSSDLLSRHPIESSHSSSRIIDSTKRAGDRYDDGRASASRDGEWIQRSYLTPTSSLSLPMSNSTVTSRDSWPFAERKIEAWDTSRLAPRTEQWISGAGATVGATGRSSMPAMAPPAPLYSAAASLALQSGGLGLGGYTSADRYDSYRGGFHPLRKY